MKKIVLGWIVLMLGVFSCHPVYGEEKQIILLKDEKDVTSSYLTQVEGFYQENNENLLGDYLDDHHLDMVVIERANSVKSISKRCALKTAKKTINGKTYTFKWNVVLKCKFSYNPNTYKIGRIYETTIGLYSKNICDGATNVTISGTPSTSLSSDGLTIHFKANYVIKGLVHGKSFTLGSYTDQASFEA